MQSYTVAANYGATDRLNVIGMVPYVWTHASQGVLADMRGFQDLTLAAKYNLIEKPFTELGSLRAIAVISGAIPLTDYTPDYYPLALGSASRRISPRFTLHFQSNPGWFLTGSAAYTWRSNVTIDRDYYFTEDRLFFGNDVPLPDVFDYILRAGVRTQDAEQLQERVSDEAGRSAGRRVLILEPTE